MRLGLHSRWLNLLHTLWFVPSVVAAGYIALAEGLVRVDAAMHVRNAWVFDGGAQAARTVLSVIAGSLITVAGVTFSVTMIVLQLTSSQFSPRVLRSYLGDRVAQLTIGSFIGIFAYCLLALRSIGNSGGTGVPRLTVTVASVLALLALAMLIVFIHHIAQLAQASELTARLGRQTLTAIDRLYPDRFGRSAREEVADSLVARWRADASPRLVLPAAPGFVQLVDLSRLSSGLSEPRPRVHILVAAGDFAYVDEPIAEVWPESTSDESGLDELVRSSVIVSSERDIEQDAHFGIRQLTDIALRAISPSVNDPTTAATCIAYLRSVLTRLAARNFPSGARRDRPDAEPLVVRRRSFAEYLDCLAEIGRCAGGDARIARDLLAALSAIGEAAIAADAEERAEAAQEIAEAVGEQALAEAGQSRDRGLVEEALEQAFSAAVPPRRG